MADEKDEIGLFLAKYVIGTAAVGGKVFTLSFTVSTVHKVVSGIGKITQTTNPPLNVTCKLDGDYTYMCVMPKECHILVVATGYPVIKWPPMGGIGPVIPPNVHLRMVLTEDWSSGVANYSYWDDNKNEWISEENVPVKQVHD